MCDSHLTEEERRIRPAGPVTFVDELVVAMTNARIYARQHPRVESSVQTLYDGLQELLREGGQSKVMLGTADGCIFFQSRPLLGASLAARRLVEQLSALDCGGLAFEDKTTLEHLHTFIQFSSRGYKGADRFDEANRKLTQDGCENIYLLPPYHEASGSWTDAVEEGWSADGSLDQSGSILQGEGFELNLDLDIPSRIYSDAVTVMQDAMMTACKGEHLDTSAARGQVESILTQLHSDPAPLLNKTRYEKYSEFTFGHSIRVCFLSLNFAFHLTEDQKLLERIGLAALMHDIGKAAVPFDVLHAQGRLDGEAWRQMQMHTEEGGRILLSKSDADPLVVAVAATHHRNMDGTGYPNCIQMARQSGATMIVKISDVFEALTSVRPYKPRMSAGRAFRIMMDMKGFFEPSLLRKFIQTTGLYPVGSRVRLSSGEIARVRAQTESLSEPVVMTEYDASGERLFPEDVETFDLREHFGNTKLEVKETILDNAA